ncbi:hypothetical protein OS493_000564 [Desmophyllum pertusum]|uniref:Uncharacterized protein n=1 Tax=Desmophyllum pertusum TaxID=174260 RepID=A0A9X0A7J0_9CNID|nr:hypothetical protein OS493_000564 [Desmophyllum pertusum]
MNRNEIIYDLRIECKVKRSEMYFRLYQYCRATRSGLLPISRELLLPRDNTAASVQENIATKRVKAKRHYDTTASSSLPPLEIDDFVYAKPSPHHKSGLWLYGLVTAIPAPRSYVVETPSGAPPPPDALVPRSWMKQLTISNLPPAANHSDPQSNPVPQPSTRLDSQPHPPNKSTQESITTAAPDPIAAPSPNTSQRPPNSPRLMELRKGTVTHSGSNTHSTPKELQLTETRSGRISKPVVRLELPYWPSTKLNLTCFCIVRTLFFHSC